MSTEKIHNLKFENHILFSRLSENFSWRYSHSALRECSKEGREEPEYRVFAEGEKKYIVKYQKITTNHKNRHLSGTNDFSGKMQESGLTEIIPLICIPAIWDKLLTRGTG